MFENIQYSSIDGLGGHSSCRIGCTWYTIEWWVDSYYNDAGESRMYRQDSEHTDEFTHQSFNATLPYCSLEILSKVFTGLAEGAPYEGAGICSILEEEYYIAIRSSCFLGWEHFSGVSDYPVPGVDGWLAEDTYDSYDLWEGEYGDSRRELCKYLALSIQKGELVLEDRVLKRLTWI